MSRKGPKFCRTPEAHDIYYYGCLQRDTLRLKAARGEIDWSEPKPGVSQDSPVPRGNTGQRGRSAKPTGLPKYTGDG